ncbi:hypothetical protein P8452_09184 [Trifolium repens]|nr:hypothetical protein P8452_09184 [Trifolium repens]
MDAFDIDKWKRSKASVGVSVSYLLSVFVLVLHLHRLLFASNSLKCQHFELTSLNFLINCSKCRFIIWWTSLIRGAVTIALFYNQFSKSEIASAEDSLMITSTIILVLFSTVVFGSITKPLIKAVKLKHSKPSIYDSTDIQEDLRLLFLENHCSINQSNNQTYRRQSSLSLMIHYPTTTVHHFWKKFNDKFMRHKFGGRSFVPVVPGSLPT